VLLAAALLCACSAGSYRAPIDGPTATLSVASTCVERASFHVRINGRRTETHGCNESATWIVPAGTLRLTVQVEQASYRVEPMRTELEVDAESCVAFLLRQTSGFELVTLSEGACE